MAVGLYANIKDHVKDLPEEINKKFQPPLGKIILFLK